MFLQSAEPQTEIEVGDGSWRVPERSKQRAVDGKDDEPVLREAQSGSKTEKGDAEWKLNTANIAA